MVYATNVDAFTSYGMSGAACGARLRASAAGGCGPHGSKSRTTATANRSPGPAAIVPPRQPYFVILNEVKNLFPCEPKAACGLCLARRRKTNEVQSRIYFGQGYRFFVAMLLRMTKREELRSARRVGTVLFHCSQTPRQTGMCNWRQRGKVEGKDARAAAVCRNTIRLQPCEPKPRPAEARKTRPTGFGTRIFLVPLLKPRTGCGSRNTASCKKQSPQKTGGKQPQRTNSFNPPAPLRRQRTAESTNHAGTNHDPHHSGCEVAVARR